jgi:hypothetical protein
MIVTYAIVANMAAIGALILLWPFGAVTAFAAAPFIASAMVLLVAGSVILRSAPVPIGDEPA